MLAVGAVARWYGQRNLLSGGAMSTGNSFQTEIPTMDVASAHVIQVNEAVQATLANHLSRLEPLMGTWQGAAAGSFQALKAQWHENANSLNEALMSIGEALKQASVNYGGSEDTNQTGFTGIAGALD